MSKIKQVTIGKEFKVGLPNFSNVTTRCDITFDISESEKPDWEAMWNEVNQQLALQTGDIDPSWLSNKEYKNFFKTTIKIPNAPMTI